MLILVKIFDSFDYESSHYLVLLVSSIFYPTTRGDADQFDFDMLFLLLLWLLLLLLLLLMQLKSLPKRTCVRYLPDKNGVITFGPPTAVANVCRATHLA